jgi:TonB family protein
MLSRAIGIIVLAQSLCFGQASAPPSVAGPSEAASLPSPQLSPTPTESNAIVAGRLIREEDPSYPKEARKQNLQGKVAVVVMIEENGKIGNPTVVSGDRILVDATLKAVRKWRFEPFTQQGYAISVQQNLVFDFAPGQKAAKLESPLPESKPVQPPITLPVTRSSAAAGGVYRIGGGVSARRVMYSPDPEYSDEARKARHEGVCVLSLIVGPDGLPRDMRITRSVGMGLDEKAIEAVNRWRFQPAMKDGKPVGVAVNVEVQFRL